MSRYEATELDYLAQIAHALDRIADALTKTNADD